MEPELRTVKVKSILVVHESVLARHAEERAELERVLMPEALARLDDAEQAAILRMLGGGE